MTNKRNEARQVRRLAREALGYERLRPGQEAAISAVLNGHDTLAVMPTGWGKSAIYQLTGLKLPGPTVVVSPLLALQRDQLESIEEREMAGAALLNSTLGANARKETLEQLAGGDLEFLFLAPEQFANEEVRERLRAARPSLFVVDEAHCISEWGQDFRPDYLRLGGVIDALGHPTVLALTATAAPPVREEIVERLGMRDPQVIVQGFDRPNLHLAVERFDKESDKREALIARVVEADKPGIIYTATRKRAEEIAGMLRQASVLAQAYHAGMKPKEREDTQAAFMDDTIEVIVATTAFGMGIDKPNVRFVFHYDISDSVDAYYQEIGRAGRDGERAEAMLFYRPEDVGIRRFFAGSGQIDVDQVEQVVTLVHEHDGPVNFRELSEVTGLSQSKLVAALSRLENVGAITTLPNGEVIADDKSLDLSVVAEEAAQNQQHYRAFERSRIEMIRGYAEVRYCRRAYLLHYFGEAFDPPCDNCDNCDAGHSIERDPNNEPFPINSQVQHAQWGTGMVMRYEGPKIVVLFGTVGYKTLGLDLVLERELLCAANAA